MFEAKSEGCKEILNIIKRHNFIPENLQESEETCIIDFRHPKIEIQKPVAYFESAVQLNKKRNVLNTTIRSKVENIKELYLDYCCEDGEMVCRPHVNMEDNILSVEASFRINPIKKFDRLLEEMK